MPHSPAKQHAWIVIRNRKRQDALLVCGSWREAARQASGAALYRVPPDVDASLLDARALIALADRLNAARAGMNATEARGSRRPDARNTP